MNAKITEIIEAAEKRGLNSFGIRQHHEQVSVGDDLPVSKHYLDDHHPEDLDGTCCLQISYDGFDVDDIEYDLEQLLSRNYPGNGPVIIVGGTRSSDGWDDSEIIIGGAECLYVF